MEACYGLRYTGTIVTIIIITIISVITVTTTIITIITPLKTFYSDLDNRVRELRASKPAKSTEIEPSYCCTCSCILAACA